MGSTNPKTAVIVSQIYFIIAMLIIFIVPYIWPRLWFRRKRISWHSRMTSHYLWFWWRRIIGLGLILSLGYSLILRAVAPRTSLAFSGTFDGGLTVFFVLSSYLVFSQHYINVLVTGVREPAETSRRIRHLNGMAFLYGLLVTIEVSLLGRLMSENAEVIRRCSRWW